MIYRIVNRAEVQTGIREAAEKRALAGGIGSPDALTVPAFEVAQSVVDRDADVRPCPPDCRPTWYFLPPFERTRLIFFAASVMALTVSEERERTLANLIDGRAEHLMCNICGAEFDHPVHGACDDDCHRFVCPHGREVGVPAECIMDHPDIVP